MDSCNVEELAPQGLGIAGKELTGAVKTLMGWDRASPVVKVPGDRHSGQVLRANGTSHLRHVRVWQPWHQQSIPGHLQQVGVVGSIVTSVCVP